MSTALHISTFLNKKYAISLEDAQKIFPLLSDAVKAGNHIEISFEGLENCSTLFLRNLLGELYMTLGTKVDIYIKFIGIDPEDEILPYQLERLRRRALNPSIYQPIFEKAISQA